MRRPRHGCLDCRGNLGRYALAALAHLALVIAWFALVKLGHIPRFVLPSPLETVQVCARSRTCLQ